MDAAVIRWIETDECVDEDAVNEAIELWHVDAGSPVPEDREFALARWDVPDGAVLGHHPDRPSAERLRVRMPCGNRYVLSIDREGDLRGESLHEVTYYRVVEAHVA